jgi:hypothetical protein
MNNLPYDRAGASASGMQQKAAKTKSLQAIEAGSANMRIIA